MKKIIAFVLAVVLCLSFAACGGKEKQSEAKADNTPTEKSQDVKDVEELIDALSDLSMDSYEEVVAAREKYVAAKAAFDDLSDDEQDAVENEKDLDTEHARLYENEYKWAALSLQYMVMNIENVISINVTIWDNVGASDFFDYQDSVMTVGEVGYSSLQSKYGTDGASATLWCAGYAIDNAYFSENFHAFSAAKITETEEKCKAYVQSMQNTKDSKESTKEFINTMINDYSEEHSNEMEALQAWWVEVSLYADHALDPSGNYNTYVSTANDYQSNIQRYQTQAGY